MAARSRRPRQRRAQFAGAGRCGGLAGFAGFPRLARSVGGRALDERCGPPLSPERDRGQAQRHPRGAELRMSGGRTPVGGIPEIVRPGCVILVRHEGPEALAGALSAAAARPWDRAAMSGMYRKAWGETASDLLEACRLAASRRSRAFTPAAILPG